MQRANKATERRHREQGSALLIVVAASLVLMALASSLYMIARANETEGEILRFDILLEDACQSGLACAEERLLRKPAALQDKALPCPPLVIHQATVAVQAQPLDEHRYTCERNGQTTTVHLWKLAAHACLDPRTGGPPYSHAMTRLVFVAETTATPAIVQRVQWTAQPAATP